MSLPGLGPVRRFTEIDSTNRYLADEARLGAAHGLVAVAAYQTAGRGRLGRKWDAPPGANLLMSVLLRPGSEPPAPHACTLAVALAAADSCRDLAGVDPGLKWPNDLVVGDLKLAGVLAEAIAGAQGGPAVVVGLGLNVGWPQKSEEAQPGATSLVRLSDVAVDLDLLLSGVLEHLAGRIADLLGSDEPAELQLEAYRALMEEYRGRCVTIGRQVRVEEPTEAFTGLAVEVTDEGQLVVDTQSGGRVVMVGDVVHLRHQPEPS
jgi:BirA family transcriptional regulator, biotin operon repressor / biotin---[acetyl-CoA-carboxylase] ligase